MSGGEDHAFALRDARQSEKAADISRGTMRMLGQASEVVTRDPRTKPVIIMQLSWSAGDHIVSRENLKTLNDLRGANGKKIIIITRHHSGPSTKQMFICKTMWGSELTFQQPQHRHLHLG